MGRLAHTAQDPVDPGAGVVSVSGRHRLPSDLLSELMDVLADEPRVVVCDLSGIAASLQTVTDVFAPLAPYLSNWPGTVVVACVPPPMTPDRTPPSTLAGRLLVREHCQDGLDEAYRLLHPLQRCMTYLPPVPTAAGEARAFTAAALRDWRLPQMAGSASLVVSELVTDSLLKAKTVVGLSLSRCEDRLRIAVHDHRGAPPSPPAEEVSEATVEESGMLLVQALTRDWGVFPARTWGKTVWAVMDAA
jgi:hypothetical protein